MEKIMEQGTERLLVQHGDDVTVVTFNDEQILEMACVKRLEESLNAIVDAWKCQNITLDFSNVHLMSSAFLGLLVKLQTRIAEKGGHLTLQKISPGIRQALEITQLTKVFDIA
jgi:anti-anti-sigma factor